MLAFSGTGRTQRVFSQEPIALRYMCVTYIECSTVHMCSACSTERVSGHSSDETMMQGKSGMEFCAACSALSASPNQLELLSESLVGIPVCEVT